MTNEKREMLRKRRFPTRGKNVEGVKHAKYQTVGLVDGGDDVATAPGQRLQQLDQSIARSTVETSLKINETKR